MISGTSPLAGSAKNILYVTLKIILGQTYCMIPRHILQMFAYHAEINYGDTGGHLPSK